MSLPLTRRNLLRSATAVVALPALESVGFRRFASAAPTVAQPKRIVFLAFGWGVTEESWYPDIKTPGPDYVLPPAFAPLARHRARFSIVQNLWHQHSVEGHWGSVYWLTGANPFAQPGQSMHNSISADQVAAAQLGLETRLASLPLDVNSRTPRSDSGHGGAVSWDARGKPIRGEAGPLQAFHRVFGGENLSLEQQRAALAEQRSVLDTVLENARDLRRQLGRDDNERLDEYFEGIRSIETRLGKEAKWLGVPKPKPPVSEPDPSFEGREEIRLMYDIIAATLETDSTRVVTYAQPVASLLTSLGISVNPHDMSHYHNVRGDKLAASQQRDLTQSELLAGLFDRLERTRLPDGSRLFDHVTVAYGSNIRTGHILDNCPMVLAGGGAGLKMGHNIVMPHHTPLCNAWLTLLRRSGVEVGKHGDSTGILKELVA